MAFTLQPLPYAQDALEPHMSAKTLALHYGKHHRAYVEKLNELSRGTALEYLSLGEIISVSGASPEMQTVFNNAAQHANHTNFWLSMKPKGGGAIPARLERRLIEDFGSVESFKSKFVSEGLSQFGSGWIWLLDLNGRLVVHKTSNAMLPEVSGGKPLLVCDVWEHAYYVDYENRRADFLKTFLEHLVDWEAADSARLSQAI